MIIPGEECQIRPLNAMCLGLSWCLLTFFAYVCMVGQAFGGIPHGVPPCCRSTRSRNKFQLILLFAISQFPPARPFRPYIDTFLLNGYYQHSWAHDMATKRSMPLLGLVVAPEYNLDYSQHHHALHLCDPSWFTRTSLRSSPS